MKNSTEHKRSRFKRDGKFGTLDAQRRRAMEPKHPYYEEMRRKVREEARNSEFEISRQFWKRKR